jgi:hypothetical protein
MIVRLSDLRLEHRGEPIVEYDTDEEVVITHFRGLECFPNYWPVGELDPRTLRVLKQVVRRRSSRGSCRASVRFLSI